jgi:hypothetical protein
MTARHLVKSSCSLSEKTQNPRLEKLKYTAKILLGLTVIFLTTYLLCHMLEMYFYSTIIFNSSSFKFVVVFVRDYNLRDIVLILQNLLSINSCLNPVALCFTSVVFKRQLKRYLSSCCKAKSPPNDLEITKRNLGCNHSHYFLPTQLRNMFHTNIYTEI